MVGFNEIIFKIAYTMPGFLFALVCHEFAHGFMAKKFGDDTAERMGRLTLNPLVHLDMIGTVLFPIMGLISGFSIIGWAKPVPIDTRNFPIKKIRKAIFWVSFAGPMANFIVATLSAFLFALFFVRIDIGEYKQAVLSLLEYSLFINILLGAFNLIPIPPLDGSKMLSSVLNYKLAYKYEKIAAYAPYLMMFIFFASFAGVSILSPILTPFMNIGYLIQNLFIILLSK